jgi:hypothetical protein
MAETTIGSEVRVVEDLAELDGSESRIVGGLASDVEK